MYVTIVLQVGIHILIFFLANLAMGSMSFCHQLGFLKIGQSKTRIACGGHVWEWIITKYALFREDLP
jgi:hypothetical protein